MEKCVICGKDARPEYKLRIEGNTYYFDTLSCLLTLYAQFEWQLTTRELVLAEDDDRLTDEKNSHSHSKISKTETCPVMGTTVMDTDKAPSASYKGNRYFFCCDSCLHKFLIQPDDYLKYV